MQINKYAIKHVFSSFFDITYSNRSYFCVVKHVFRIKKFLGNKIERRLNYEKVKKFFRKLSDADANIWGYVMTHPF